MAESKVDCEKLREFPPQRRALSLRHEIRFKRRQSRDVLCDQSCSISYFLPVFSSNYTTRGFRSGGFAGACQSFAARDSLMRRPLFRHLEKKKKNPTNHRHCLLVGLHFCSQGTLCLHLVDSNTAGMFYWCTSVKYFFPHFWTNICISWESTMFFCFFFHSFQIFLVIVFA